ncbi:Tim10/DDP family zinc finger protein [Sphingomonas beigongshangi]|uniref:Tim10/DDP family zinc finger protein n=1 Tax=Sphingomonas beigongshangi TaxID=2782540 RepID=UPI00193C1EB0|nr:Tim10/DDP family zinc finger protein [Sphingomonas beigongshangi]
MKLFTFVASVAVFLVPSAALAQREVTCSDNCYNRYVDAMNNCEAIFQQESFGGYNTAAGFDRDNCQAAAQADYNQCQDYCAYNG